MHALCKSSTLIKCSWCGRQSGRKRWEGFPENGGISVLLIQQCQWPILVCDLCRMTVKVSNNQQCWRVALTELSLSIAVTSHRLENNKCSPYQFLPFHLIVSMLFSLWLCSPTAVHFPLLSCYRWLLPKSKSEPWKKKKTSLGKIVEVKKNCIFFKNSISREGSNSSTAVELGSFSCTGQPS